MAPRGQSRQAEKNWIQRLQWALEYGPQIVTAVAAGGAFFARKVPSIASYGAFGMIVVGVLLFLLLSISLAAIAWAKGSPPTDGGNRAKKGRAKLLAWIVSILVVICCAFFPQHPYISPQIERSLIKLPIATNEELKGEKIEGRTVFAYQLEPTLVRVPGFAMKTGQVTGKAFVNCDIFGPVIFQMAGTCIINGNSFMNPFSTFTPQVETHVYETTARVSTGSLPMIDCSFLNCRFFNVGFAGDKAFVEQFKQGVSK